MNYSRISLHGLFPHRSYWSLLVLAMLTLVSCSTPYNVTYFQDMPIEKRVPIVKPQSIRLRPQDRVSILVSTRDASLSQMFSLHSTYSVSNIGSSSSSSSTRQPSEYTIAADGTIDFPILGRLTVQGYTREELQNYIKDELINRNLVKDPIVTVEYVNLNVLVIGAIGTSRIAIDRDQFTLLDAITQAGDLKLEGMRENVRVIREAGLNQRISYEVNLCSAEELYNSPVYYLQQNDLIYVEPNNKTKRNTTEYGSRMVNYTFWTGLLTSALTIFAIFKK